MRFLNSPYARVLTVVIVLLGVAYYAAALRPELTPSIGPLETFPTSLPGWTMKQEFPLEKEVQEVLNADDTLNREYVGTGGPGDLVFYIAFFKTQRYGQSPHSPKNCLPGAGYEPVANMSGTVRIAVPGWPAPIEVNKYVTERGDERSVTLYWYQSHNRVIASEYWAKFWLVLDAIRFRRSDTSIVRIVVPVVDNQFDAATNTGIRFVQAMFPSLLKVLPV